MTDHDVKRVACLIGLAWAINIAVTMSSGIHSELYPMTAWPMYTQAIEPHLAYYRFDVYPERNAKPLALSISRMVKRKSTHDGTTSQMIYTRLAKEWSDDRSRGIAPRIPPDLRTIWFTNAKHFLKLEREPYAIELVKCEFDLHLPREDAVHPTRRTVLVSLRSGEPDAGE